MYGRSGGGQRGRGGGGQQRGGQRSRGGRDAGRSDWRGGGQGGGRGDRRGGGGGRSGSQEGGLSRGGRSDFRAEGSREQRGQGGARVGRGAGGGRGQDAPDLSNINRVMTNIIPATITEHFSFYQYTIDSSDKNGKQLESRSRRDQLFRQGLWDKLLSNEAESTVRELKRHVFFAGSFFFSSRPIPGLEPSKLPYTLQDGSDTEGDSMICVSVAHFKAPTILQDKPAAQGEEKLSHVSFDQTRCSGCSQAFADGDALLQHCSATGHSPIYTSRGAVPSAPELFVSYVSLALQRAMGERLARWGAEFVDPKQPMPQFDSRGNDLGIDLYEAYSASFGILSIEGKPQLALTCDLRAKIARRMSLHDAMHAGRRPNTPFSKQEIETLQKKWIGEVVICKYDRKCYSITGLDFKHSAATLPIPGLGMTHADYFLKRKDIVLQHPDAFPMIEVMGRRDQKIYFPAELVAGNELDPRVREMLPKVASFPPQKRNAAIEVVKRFLLPGAQRSKSAGGFLPSIGVVLAESRVVAQAKVMPAPRMIAGGVEIPKRNAENWAPKLATAHFNVNPKSAVQLNVVIVHHEHLKASVSKVYGRIKDMVNGFNATYRFGEKPFAVVSAGDNDRHWGAVERHFTGSQPANIFVLDFCKPRGAHDQAYPVIKHILTSRGYLSQFVNFKTYAHDNPRDERRSSIILQGVARQILQKSGVRLWWVHIPRSLPVPAVFVGVDVFHAPVVYDPRTGKKGRKASSAGIIVQVIRDHDSKSTIEFYSKCYRREGGEEYSLGAAIQETVKDALKYLKVSPASVVVWRDGIADAEFELAAKEEIQATRLAVQNANLVVGKKSATPRKPASLAYVVCQKRIAVKLLSQDGQYGAPSGTLVSSLQGLKHQTFYINGRAPPFSTPKPVRFTIVERDDALNDVPIAELTWGQCHDYPNWTGPVKVPSVCQLAHKLAELAGTMHDGGQMINSAAFLNKMHFL